MRVPFIALAVILGLIVCGFLGYVYWRWREARDEEMKTAATVDRELSRACAIAAEIRSIEVFLAELQVASDLAPGSGAVSTAMYHVHPLRQRAEDRIKHLQAVLLDE